MRMIPNWTGHQDPDSGSKQRPSRAPGSKAEIRLVAANLIPSKWALHNTARKLWDDSSLARCHITVQVQRDWVEIHGDQAGGAWYSNLHTCKNIWACPICAPKITKVRATELQTGLDLAIEARRGVYLATYTIPHAHGQPLRATQRALATAQRKMKATRAYKRLQADLGHIGDVRTLEITHGRGGWHPHVHTLTFLQSPLVVRPGVRNDVQRYRRRLYLLWARACEKAGLPRPLYRAKDGHYVGVDVRSARHAAAYVSKWGLAAELTGSASKLGKKDSITPWGLLVRAHDGAAGAGALWAEFARTMKGQRQLFWSRGLRKKLGLGVELTEQECIEWEPPKTECLAEIAVDDWILICAGGMRGEVLALARDRPGVLEAALSRMRDLVAEQHIDVSKRGWRRHIRWDSWRGYWS